MLHSELGRFLEHLFLRSGAKQVLRHGYKCGWVGRDSMAGSPHAGKCHQTAGDPGGIHPAAMSDTAQLVGRSSKNTLCTQAPYEASEEHHGYPERDGSCIPGTRGAIASQCPAASTKPQRPANSSAAATACNQRDGGTSPSFKWLQIILVPPHFLQHVSKNAQPQPSQAHRIPSMKSLIRQLQQGLSPRSSAPGCTTSSIAEH